jgi:protease-4
MSNRSWFKLFLIFSFIGAIGYCGHQLQQVVATKTEIKMESVKKNSILKLNLHGVILNGKKFLNTLKEYRDEKNIKALLVDIQSPGGAVGPSQEIFLELKRFKEKTQKPVICVATNMIASGAYYAAMACDKLIVTPGALVGSIGVIMEFANLEQLYSWAKISRYSITSGKFKDAGAEYRPMSVEEKQLFQDMITEVYNQFREAVKQGRSLDDETLNNYADGRVFTGDAAVKLKFADQIGTLEDAIELAAKVANLGEDYKVIEPGRNQNHWWSFIADEQEDELNSLSGESSIAKKIKSLGIESSSFINSSEVKKLLRAEYLNQPMLILPGYWQ